jgi:hypothetical protein
MQCNAMQWWETISKRAFEYVRSRHM